VIEVAEVTVDPDPDARLPAIRLDVDVAGPFGYGVEQENIEQFLRRFGGTGVGGKQIIGKAGRCCLCIPRVVGGRLDRHSQASQVGRGNHDTPD